jgi:hypothetical protein
MSDTRVHGVQLILLLLLFRNGLRGPGAKAPDAISGRPGDRRPASVLALEFAAAMVVHRRAHFTICPKRPAASIVAK